MDLKKKVLGFGITIPEHIKVVLPYSTVEILEKDGHGISFNSKISSHMYHMGNIFLRTYEAPVYSKQYLHP